MIDSFSRSTIDFSVLSVFYQKYEEVPCKPSSLNHCLKSLFFRVSVPSMQQPDRRAQPSSSWEHQHNSSHGNGGDQAPTARGFQRSCRTPHSQNLWCDGMWPQVIGIILFLELYRETYFPCILDFLLLPLFSSQTQKINRCPQNLLRSPFLWSGGCFFVLSIVSIFEIQSKNLILWLGDEELCQVGLLICL